MILRLEFNTTSPASASQRTGGDGGKVEGRGKGGGGQGSGQGECAELVEQGPEEGGLGGLGCHEFFGQLGEGLGGGYSVKPPTQDA